MEEEEFIGYHGTKPERVSGILKDGFSLNASKVSDPGDLGRGVYLFSCKADTKVWGQARLRVTVRGKFLKVNYPTEHAVFEDLTPECGDTVRGNGGPTYEHVWQERLDAAWAYRKHFIGLGYDGLLVWGYDTFPGRKDRYELVVFNLDSIQEVALDGKQKSVWR